MFRATIKGKLRGALAALLAISFIITSGTLTVFANSGAGAGEPGGVATAEGFNSFLRHVSKTVV
jgi:hypothetical protein